MITFQNNSEVVVLFYLNIFESEQGKLVGFGLGLLAVMDVFLVRRLIGTMRGFLRIFNPILMFSIVLFVLLYFVDIPLVLAVSVACLTAAINFSVMSMILRNLRREK